MSWQDAKSGGAGGGVKSITGDDVDNSDPSNPVIISKAYFIASTLTTVSVGLDPASPSFLTGLALSPNTVGFSLDSITGAVKNETGRSLADMIGTINFQPDKSGGGTTVLSIWSERSTDGLVWTQNSESLRTIEIANNGETFKTSISGVTDWDSGDFLRFRCYANGAIDFVSPTDTVLGGEVIVGSSVLWELRES